MSSTYGSDLRITIFGQSHAPAIGVTIEGFRSGLRVDTEALESFLARRAPGRAAYATARRETDKPEFLCGSTASPPARPSPPSYETPTRAAEITRPFCTSPAPVTRTTPAG